MSDDTQSESKVDEIDVMRTCWGQLESLTPHERARVLLWLTRKHQNAGLRIDWRALEQEAIEP